MLDNFQKKAKDMRSRVFKHMLETRGWKYRVFLRHLRFFKYIAFAPIRGEFLESYYTLMRFLDDVVDGDFPLPDGYKNGVEYLMEKINFSKKPARPKDEVDYLMLYCFELAEKFGEEFSEETKDILESLLFDAERRGKMIIYPKEKLEHHFHLLDIRGTVRATLKVFKDDPDKYGILAPLSMACRYQFDLEDFETDIAAGYVNIPKEECEHFGITADDLYDVSSPKIKKWLRHRAMEGMELLREHHRREPEGNFSLLQRLVFQYVYEAPARNVFKKIIHGN